MGQRKLLILGMGMQGKGALHDALASGKFSAISVADCGAEFVAMMPHYRTQGVEPFLLDANDDAALLALIKAHDIVIELLPVEFAMKVGMMAAENGVCLVSSMYYISQSMTDPEKVAEGKRQLERLNAVAKTTGASLMIAFGMDPGLDLMLGGELLREIPEIETFYSYGAGFPDENCERNPIDYKFSWSPHSTLVSYFRKTKKIIDGKVVHVPAEKLFSPEHTHVLNDPQLGYPVECYSAGDSENFANMFSILGKVKHMDRFSARKVGHCAFWDKMVNCGFLNTDPVRINGVDIAPVDFVTALMTSQSQFWYKEDERDVGYIRIEGSGMCHGARKRIVYTIVDFKDLETGLTSMQRLVGFTVSIVAGLMADGVYKEPGLHLPMDMKLELMEGELKKRNILIKKEVLP